MADIRHLDYTPVTNNMLYSEVHGNGCGDSAESAAEKHEKYLIALDKHNKFLKKLNARNNKQEELQKREQAFSPYVNGANAVLQKNSEISRKKPGSNTPRPSQAKKTNAGEAARRTAVTPRPKSVASLPRKSAAFRNGPRKYWGQGSIQIKTSDGQTLRAAMNEDDYLYSDDFEEYDSSDSVDECLEFEEDVSTSVDENLCRNVLTSRKRWKDFPQITSSQVAQNDSASDSDSLDISCSEIPVLGQTSYKIRFS